MKRVLFSVLIICGCQLVRAASVPTYDGFAYDANFDLGTQTDTNTDITRFSWTHTGTTVGSGLLLIASDNLSYPGLQTSVGNCIETFFAGSQGLRYQSRNVNIISSTQNGVYYSALIKITSLGALSGNAYILALNNTSATNQTTFPTTLPARTYLRPSATAQKYNIGVLCSYPGTVTPTYATNDFAVGDTVFVVVGYNNAPLSVNMWINPDPNTLAAASPPPATLTNTTGGTTAINIQSLLVVNQTANTPQYELDELRIGTNWAQVTAGGPPGFTNPLPATVSANYSGTVTLNPGTAGPGTITYQWTKGGNPLSNGAGFSGTTSPTLTITNANGPESGSYALVATSSYGSSTCSTAVLTVTDPYITSQPSNKSVPPGSSAIFSVSAVGTPSLSYRWQKNGSDVSGPNIFGATTASLTVTGASDNDVASYTVNVKNGLGSITTSSPGVLTVLDPAITSNPTNVTVNYGSNAVFHVTASGTAPFTYQWQNSSGNLSDGAKYPGFNSPNLTVVNCAATDADSFTVLVGNSIGGFTTSSPAVLTVNDPFLISQPVSQTVVSGTSPSFSVNASGSGTLQYQWSRITNGVSFNLSDGGTISGSTTSSLSFSGTTTNDSGTYFVTVTGVQPLVTTQATLTVIAPPGIVSGLQSRVVSPGDRVVFAAGLSGSPPTSYVWTKNNNPLAGQSGSSLSVSNISSADLGTYSLVVSNFAGTATSSATLGLSAPGVKLFQGNLVVLRVGDGAQTLALSGNSSYLDQFNTAGSYLNTVSIPDSGSSPFLLPGGGSTFTDCQMTRSSDGTLLSIAGYATNFSYGGSLQASAGSLVSRAICTLDSFGTSRLAKTTKNFSSGAIFRSAATDGAGNFWGTSGTGGHYYFGNGTNPATVISIAVTNSDGLWTNVDNIRVGNIFNGDLYFSTGQGSNLLQGIWKYDGTPVTRTDPYPIILCRGGTGTPSPLGFSVSPNGQTVYVADDRSNGSGGIQRYDYYSSTNGFGLTYTLGTGVANIGARGIAVDWSGAQPVIYATTAENTYNRLISIVDSGASATASTLATSGFNELFHSVQFAPVEPGLTAIISANNLQLSWPDPDSSFTLEYNTDLAAGSWNPVGITPTSNGGTNSVTLPLDSNAKFFRLRK